MTERQMEEIKAYRMQGECFSSIAEKMGLPVREVNDYCNAHKLGKKDLPYAQGICKHCGKPMPLPRGPKRKRFCSDACRIKYWHIHADEMNKQADEGYTCKYCNKPFRAYPYQHRKYCSHECYILARFGGGRHD